MPRMKAYASFDPKGLLQGKGAYVRHTKVRRPVEIDERAFAALLKQAVGSKGRA
jgi:hypothetical protein